MLLLIPAAALAVAACGGILRSGRAVAERCPASLAGALFWTATFAAGAAALYVIATGRPA